MSDSPYSTHIEGIIPRGWAPALTSCIVNACELSGNLLSLLPNARQTTASPQAESNPASTGEQTENPTNNSNEMFLAHGLMGGAAPIILGNVDSPEVGPFWSGFGVPCHPFPPPAIIGPHMGLHNGPMCPCCSSMFFGQRMPMTTCPRDTTHVPSAGDSTAVRCPCENAEKKSKTNRKTVEESSEPLDGRQRTVRKVQKRILKKGNKCKSDAQLRKYRKVYTAPKALRKKSTKDFSDVSKNLKSQRLIRKMKVTAGLIPPCRVGISNYDGNLITQFAGPIPTRREPKKKQKKPASRDTSSETCTPSCDTLFGDSQTNLEPNYGLSEPVGKYNRREERKKKCKESTVKEMFESRFESNLESESSEEPIPENENDLRVSSIIPETKTCACSINRESSQISLQTIDEFMSTVVRQYRKSQKDKSVATSGDYSDTGVRHKIPLGVKKYKTQPKTIKIKVDPKFCNRSSSDLNESPHEYDEIDSKTCCQEKNPSNEQETMPSSISLPVRGGIKCLEGVPMSENIGNRAGNIGTKREMFREEDGERYSTNNMNCSIPRNNSECLSLNRAYSAQTFKVCGPRLESIAEEGAPQHPSKSYSVKKSHSTHNQMSRIRVCSNDNEVVFATKGHSTDIPMRICCSRDNLKNVKREIILESDGCPNLPPCPRNKINLSGVSSQRQEAMDENGKKKNPVKYCACKHGCTIQRDINKMGVINSLKSSSNLPGKTCSQHSLSKPPSRQQCNKTTNSRENLSKSEHGFSSSRNIHSRRDKISKERSYECLNRYRKRCFRNVYGEDSVSLNLHGYHSPADRRSHNNARPGAVFCLAKGSAFSELNAIKRCPPKSTNYGQNVANCPYVEKEEVCDSREKEEPEYQVNSDIVNTVCVPLIPGKWQESEKEMALLGQRKQQSREINEKETTNSTHSYTQEDQYADKLRHVRESISEIVYEQILKVKDNKSNSVGNTDCLHLCKSCFHSFEPKETGERGDIAFKRLGCDFLDDISLPLSRENEGNENHRRHFVCDNRQEQSDRYIQDIPYCSDDHPSKKCFPTVRNQECGIQMETEKRNFCRLFLHDSTKENVYDPKKANKLPHISLKRTAQHPVSHHSSSNHKDQTTTLPRYSQRSSDRMTTMEIQPRNRKRINYPHRSLKQEIDANDKSRKIHSKEQNSLPHSSGFNESKYFSSRERSHEPPSRCYSEDSQGRPARFSPLSNGSQQFNLPYRCRFQNSSQIINGNVTSQGTVSTIGNITPSREKTNESGNCYTKHGHSAWTHSCSSCKSLSSQYLDVYGKRHYHRNVRLPQEFYSSTPLQKLSPEKMTRDNYKWEKYNHSRIGNVYGLNNTDECDSKASVLYHSEVLPNYSKESFYKSSRGDQRWNSIPNIPTHCKCHKPVMRPIMAPVSMSSSSTILSSAKMSFESVPRTTHAKYQHQLLQNGPSKNCTNKSQVKSERADEFPDKLIGESIGTKPGKISGNGFRSSLHSKQYGPKCMHTQQSNNTASRQEMVLETEHQRCIARKTCNPQCILPDSDQRQNITYNNERARRNNCIEHKAAEETSPSLRDPINSNRDVESHKSGRFICENSKCYAPMQRGDSERIANKNDIQVNVCSRPDSVNVRECNIFNVQKTSACLSGEVHNNPDQGHASLDRNFSPNREGGNTSEYPQMSSDGRSILGEHSVSSSSPDCTKYILGIANTRADNRKCLYDPKQYTDRSSLNEADVSSLSSYSPNIGMKKGDKNANNAVIHYRASQYGDRSALGETDVISLPPFSRRHSKCKLPGNPESPICIDQQDNRSSLGDHPQTPMVSNNQRCGNHIDNCNIYTNKEFNHSLEGIQDLRSSPNIPCPLGNIGESIITLSKNPENIKIHTSPLSRDKNSNITSIKEYAEEGQNNDLYISGNAEYCSESTQGNGERTGQLVHFPHVQHSHHKNHLNQTNRDISKNNYSQEATTKDLPTKLNNLLNINSETQNSPLLNCLINISKSQEKDPYGTSLLYWRQNTSMKNTQSHMDSRGNTKKRSTSEESKVGDRHPQKSTSKQRNESTTASSRRLSQNYVNKYHESVMRPVMKPISASSASTILSCSGVTFEVTNEKGLPQKESKIKSNAIPENLLGLFWQKCHQNCNEEHVCNQYAARYKVPLNNRVPSSNTDDLQNNNKSNKRLTIFFEQPLCPVHNEHQNKSPKQEPPPCKEDDGEQTNFGAFGKEPCINVAKNAIPSNAQETKEKNHPITQDDTNRSDTLSGYMCKALSRAIYHAMCKPDTYSAWKSAIDTFPPVAIEVVPAAKQLIPSGHNAPTPTKPQKETVYPRKRRRHRTCSQSVSYKKSHKHRTSKSYEPYFKSRYKRKYVSSHSSSSSSSSSLSSSSSSSESSFKSTVDRSLKGHSKNIRSSSRGRNTRLSTTWSEAAKHSSFLKVTEIKKKTIQSMPGVRSKVVKDISGSISRCKKEVKNESQNLRNISISEDKKSSRTISDERSTFKDIFKASQNSERKEKTLEKNENFVPQDLKSSSRTEKFNDVNRPLQQELKESQHVNPVPINPIGKSVQLSCSPIIQVNKLPEDLNELEKHESLTRVSLNEINKESPSPCSYEYQRPTVNECIDTAPMIVMDSHQDSSAENNRPEEKNVKKAIETYSNENVVNSFLQLSPSEGISETRLECNTLINSIDMNTAEKLNEMSSINTSTKSSNPSPTDSLVLQIEQFKKSLPLKNGKQCQNADFRNDSKTTQVRECNFAISDVISDSEITPCQWNNTSKGSMNKGQKWSVYKLLK